MRALRWGLLGAISLFSVSALGADAAQTAEGKAAFVAGVNLLKDPDGAKYDEALAQFRRSYELLQTWKVLGNLGICALKLERDGEAVEAYEKYLAGGGKDIEPEERAQVERDLSTLRAQVVKVHIEVPGTKIGITDERVNARGLKVVNEYSVASGAADLGLHPGHHVLSAHFPQGDARWDVDLSPGSSQTHRFEAPAAAPTPPTVAPVVGKPTVGDTGPAESTGRPIPTSVWIAGGTTGALAIGTVVTGVAALSRRSAYNDINGKAGESSGDVQSAHDAATSMGMINTVLFGATVVGAGVTAYLYFTRPEKKILKGSPMVAPWVTADGGGLVLGGNL